MRARANVFAAIVNSADAAAQVAVFGVVSLGFREGELFVGFLLLSALLFLVFDVRIDLSLASALLLARLSASVRGLLLLALLFAALDRPCAIAGILGLVVACPAIEHAALEWGS